MAARGDKPAPDGWTFSKDAWISEKKGISRARDAKTGKLISKDLNGTWKRSKNGHDRNA